MLHLSKEQLKDLVYGAATEQALGDALSHLAVCPSCLAEAESLMSGRGSKRGSAKVIRDLLDFETERVVEMLLADAQWAELRRLGSKAQKERIATSAACKTYTFVRLMLDQLRGTSAWEEAERMAALVAAAIHAMDPGDADAERKNDLRGETMIELANSRRRAAEWKRSEDALLKASAFLEAGTGDRRLKARHLAISASLEADKGNVQSAVRSYGACKEIYTTLGDTYLVARTLIQIADVLSEPDPKSGLRHLDEAFEYLAQPDPLLLNARLLKTDCLIWTGQVREASRWFLACNYPREGRMLIRYRFIGARLLQALGYVRDGERLLNEVVTDDLENELFKDAFLDLLYLLKVHVSNGESEKAAQVCRRAINEPVLAAFSHEQLRGLWRQILSVVEAPIDASIFAAAKLYLSLHWRHPAPKLPFIFVPE